MSILLKNSVETGPLRMSDQVSSIIQRVVGIIGAVLMMVGIALALVKIARDPAWPSTVDLSLYLDAAQLFAQGQSPYVFNGSQDPFAYPPLVAALVAAAGHLLGYGKLWIIWPCLSIGCLVGSMLLLRNFGRVVPDEWLLFLTGILLCSRVVRSDLYHGQINLLLLFVTLLGLRSFLKFDDVRGAIAWAFVIVCKPFMGVLIFYLICRRSWRAAVLTASIAAVLFTGPFLLISNPIEGVRGWLATSAFYTMLPAAARQDHQSFRSLAMRLFGENPYSVPWFDAPAIIPVVGFLAAAIAVGIFLVAIALLPDPTTRGEASDAGRSLTEIGLTLGLALSCGPLMEGDHLILIWPALYGALLSARQSPIGGSALRRWRLAAVTWSLAFCAFALPVTVPLIVTPDWPVLQGPAILLSGRNGFMVLLACLLSMYALRASAVTRRSFKQN